MIQFSTVESLGEVPAQEWDALAGERSFYLSHAWLTAQDTGQPIDAAYLTARLHGRLVGALPVYQVRSETNAFYLPGQCADGRWQGRYLIAGARRAYANDLLVAVDLAAQDRAEVTAGLLARLRKRVAEASASGALFLYLTTAAARRLGVDVPDVHPVLTTMEAVLQLPPPGFDSYLRTLSPHRRRVIKHEIDVFGQAGLAATVEPAAGIWEQMVPLLASLQRRYGSDAPEEYWRGLLRRQAADIDDHAIVFTCRHGGTLLGACLGYVWHDTLYVKLCGFDYSRLCDRFEYFNLVYYEPIRYAYENALSRIHYGREAFSAKINRGARLAPLWSVEIPAAGCPPPRSAADWNRATAAAWSAEFTIHPGISMTRAGRCGDAA